MRHIVATCLTTLPAEDQTWVDWNEDGERFVVTHPRMEMDHMWTTMQPATDVHNKLRQKGLVMEKAWVTKKWECRVFCTATAVMTTNSFLAFAQLTEQGRNKYKMSDQNTFAKALAKQMLYNPWRSEQMVYKVHQRQAMMYHRQLQKMMTMNLGTVQTAEVKNASASFAMAGVTVVPTTPGGVTRAAATVTVQAATDHGTVKPLSEYRYLREDFKGGKQQWSKCCKRKTSYFCVGCGFDMPICNRPHCIALHKANPNSRYTGPRYHAK